MAATSVKLPARTIVSPTCGTFSPMVSPLGTSFKAAPIASSVSQAVLTPGLPPVSLAAAKMAAAATAQALPLASHFATEPLPKATPRMSAAPTAGLRNAAPGLFGGRSFTVANPGVRKTAASEAGGGGGSLRDLGKLSLTSAEFDPAAHLPKLVQLLAPLGQPLQGSPSARRLGINHGVWILAGGSKELWVLKHVSAQRRCPRLPTDLEQCQALAQKFPALLRDPKLAFPHSFISLQADGVHVGSLLISRVAPGEQLGAYMSRTARDSGRLERVCQEVGALLAEFHNKYADPVSGEATNHRDFHPSNVLYDERTGALSIVDLSGMGTWGPNDDVEKFEKLTRQLAGERCATAFAERYRALSRTKQPSSSGPVATKGLLYAPGCEKGVAPEVGPQVFKHLSTLVVQPGAAFDPDKHLTTMAWLLSPTESVRRPALKKVGVSGDVWVFQSENRPPYLLKKVSAKRKFDSLPTDAENCEALVQKFPGLLSDERLAFPHSVIPLQTSGNHVADLLVSRWCPGEQLGTVMARLDLKRPADQEKLEKVCERVGAQLADFHRKYVDGDSGEAVHHTDFHPSNVLYDEASGLVSFVDLSGMGAESAPKDDVEKFGRVMRQWAGERYATAFASGYKSGFKPGSKAAQSVGFLFSGPMWLCSASDHTQSDSESDQDSLLKDPLKEDQEQCRVM